MKIKLIACEVFSREFCLATAVSPHLFDLKFMPFGLHNTPDDLRSALQAEIDAAEDGGYDYIALGYGLCSRGTAEVRAGSTPIVIPRAHDCITLFLGSRACYDHEFAAHPGTYYYSPGWVERRDGEVSQGPIEDAHARLYKDRYEEYVDKYGEDNARFLIEQESQWLANYTRAVFINTGIGDIEEYRRFTQNLAKGRDWDYAEIKGDTGLIERLANGDWDSDDFLKVEPHQTIIESFDELILKAT